MQRDGNGDKSQYPFSRSPRKEKNIEEVLQPFWWPGISKDVGEVCKTCSKCQMMSSRKVCPVPLIPLPVMEVPFQRKVMDVVRPRE